MILDLLPRLAPLRFVLASGSPRRVELLQRIGLQPLVRVSSFPEDLPHGNDPAAYALATARAKAMDVARTLQSAAEPWDLLLACDSIVVDSQGAVLEKPSDAEHAARMLRFLSGGTSRVISAVVLLCRTPPTLAPDGMAVEELHLAALAAAPVSRCYAVSFAESTTVQFAALTEGLIGSYAAQPDAWRGKAGGYGIQDTAAQFITGITGCYYNVMGLPLHRVCAAVRACVPLSEAPTVRSEPSL